MNLEEKIKVIPGLAIMCVGCIISVAYENNPFLVGSIAKYLGFGLFIVGIFLSTIPFDSGIILLPGLGTLGGGIVITSMYTSSNDINGLLGQVIGYLMIIGGFVLIYALLDECKKQSSDEQDD